MDNKELTSFLALLAMVLFFGFAIGMSLRSNISTDNDTLIEHGCMEYNSSTGELQFTKPYRKKIKNVDTVDTVDIKDKK